MHGEAIHAISIYGAIDSSGRMLFWGHVPEPHEHYNMKLLHGEHISIEVFHMEQVGRDGGGDAHMKAFPLLSTSYSKVRFEPFPMWVSPNDDFGYSMHWTSMIISIPCCNIPVHIFSHKKSGCMRFVCFEMSLSVFGQFAKEARIGNAIETTGMATYMKGVPLPSDSFKSPIGYEK